MKLPPAPIIDRERCQVHVVEVVGHLPSTDVYSTTWDQCRHTYQAPAWQQMNMEDPAAIFSCTSVHSTLPVDHTNIARFKNLISFEFDNIYSSLTMPIKVWVYIVITAI